MPRRIHGLLFGELAPGHAATARTKRIALFSVGVEGVPAIHVEEALWVCAEALGVPVVGVRGGPVISSAGPRMRRGWSC